MSESEKSNQGQEGQKVEQPTIDIPTGPIKKPELKGPEGQGGQGGQQEPSQTPTISITNIQGLSITDKLLHAKGNISVQALTEDVNYFRLGGGQLQVHMGSSILLLDTPKLETDKLRTQLSPCFYKLNIGESLICFNQKKLSYYVFNHEQGNAVLVFRSGETLTLTVEKEQRDQVFTNFAEHHEMIIRS